MQPHLKRRGARLVAVTAVLGLASLVPVGSGTAQERNGQQPGQPTGRSAAAPTGGQAPSGGPGPPGEVVQAEPSAFRTVPGVPSNTSAWKVHYRSTTADGKPNTVSGTVIVPHNDRKGPRPLLTYAVGTVGMGDQCAPSATLPQGRATEGLLIKGALVRGWAVAVTDYEGLGTPGDHTYTVGRAEGTAVLDAARAAQRLPGARDMGVSGASPIGVMGYSQGGQASSWAAQLHHSYAPELNVKGTATGGVPADLEKTAAYNDGDPDAGLVLMSAIGHDAAFPGLQLDSYLNAKGRQLASYMRQNCVAENNEAGANKRIEQVTDRNPLDQPDWRRALRADRLGRTAPDRPVYLYHGDADEIIPYNVGQQLREDWCARGVDVHWSTFPLQQHLGGAVLGSGPAMNWLGARFAGLPTHGNCGKQN